MLWATKKLAYGTPLGRTFKEKQEKFTNFSHFEVLSTCPSHGRAECKTPCKAALGSFSVHMHWVELCICADATSQSCFVLPQPTRHLLAFIFYLSTHPRFMAIPEAVNVPNRVSILPNLLISADSIFFCDCEETFKVPLL